MKRSSAVLASLSFLLLLSACEEPVEPTSPDVSLATQQASDVSGKIVLLDPAVAPGGVAENRAEAASVAREYGVSPDHSYGAAVYGFAGVVPEGRLAALQQDDRVVLVEDVEAWELAQQAVPTGVDRIEVDLNPTVTTDGSGTAVDMDIGIIDTGISDHEDLNIGQRVSFAGGDGTDGNGHGTHVAGTAAALDNGVGVVGAAPGATVHGAKVCKNSGMCFTGDIVAGIDWVAEQKSTGAIDFASANMSIGTSDEDFTCEDGDPGAVHQAICGAVNEGVVFVIAAGNDDREKEAYPEAFAVSAIADFDGKGGGVADPTCRSDEDDTRANFSNWGSTLDVAAPGTCIRSTWNDGGYNTISGTSMAAPHATGAVALYLHANGLSPATSATGVEDIEDAIVGDALPYGTDNHECSYDNDASDQSTEPLLFTNGSAFGGEDGSCEVATTDTDPVTDVATTAVDAPSSVTVGDVVEVDVTIENVGTEDVSEDITVTLDDDTDDQEIGSQTVSGLAAGTSTTLTYSWDTEGASTDDHTLTGSHDLDDDDDTNDSESTTVEVTEESTGDNPPAIDVFDPSPRVTGPWNRVDVEWTVSDEDGDLATVTSELFDADGNPLDDEQSSVSGSDASGEHSLRTREGEGGEELTVRLTVTDEAGNETSQEKTVSF